MAAFVNVWMASKQKAEMLCYNPNRVFTATNFLKHNRAIAYQFTAFRIWYA